MAPEVTKMWGNQRRRARSFQKQQRHMTVTGDLDGYDTFALFGIALDAWHEQSSPGPYEFPEVFAGATLSVQIVQAETISPLWRRTRLTLRTGGGVPYQYALDLAHAIGALSAIVPFCAESSAEVMVLPVTAVAARELASDWSKERLERFAVTEVGQVFGDVGLFRVSPSWTHILQAEQLAGMMPFVRRYAEDRGFARGVSYLHASMVGLGVDACDWAGEGFGERFYRYVPISTAEAAFVNAFKSLEAIVGEPGNDRTSRRFRERIIKQGMSPDEEVGYRGMKEPLIEKVLRYHKIRDQVAAHGLGGLKRDIAMSEILDLQRAARYVLLREPTTDIVGHAPAIRTTHPLLDAD